MADQPVLPQQLMVGFSVCTKAKVEYTPCFLFFFRLWTRHVCKFLV